MQSISATELKALLAGPVEFALFDVREAGEADRGHILGATFLPRRMLESRLAELVQDLATPVIVYDEGGTYAPGTSRAQLAAAAIERAGYRDARVLDGGADAWEGAGGKLTSGSNVASKLFGEEIWTRDHVPQLPPQTLHAWQASDKPHIVCDIRTPEEYKRAHIPRALGAFGVDLGLSAADLASKNVPVVVHCAGRTRSIIACQTLRALGVPEVYALEDGTMGWILAGYELEQGPAGRVLEPTAPSRESMAVRARALGEEAGVKAATGDELRDWLRQRTDGAMNLHVLDVRQVPDYEAGHVPGARTLPGGLAIQRTDEFVAVKNARIVLIDDGEARAWITGYWLARMGYPNVRVLAGGLERWRAEGGNVERGRSRSTPLLLERTKKSTRMVPAAELKTRLDTGTIAAVIDVDSSRYFAEGHVPGARWIPYGSLEARIADAAPAPGSAIVLCCHNGVYSAYAAANLQRIGYTDVSVLEGGMAQWSKSGLELAKGLDGAVADDIVVPPYNSNKEEMAKYLAWEKKLTHGPQPGG